MTISNTLETRDELTYFSDVRLAALEKHICEALAANGLPPLRRELFRAHLLRVQRARDQVTCGVSV